LILFFLIKIPETDDSSKNQRTIQHSFSQSWRHPGQCFCGGRIFTTTWNYKKNCPTSTKGFVEQNHALSEISIAKIRPKFKRKLKIFFGT
jgi:hypothetical protein